MRWLTSARSVRGVERLLERGFAHRRRGSACARGGERAAGEEDHARGLLGAPAARARSCSSMPVISGIIRSQRITSKRSPGSMRSQRLGARWSTASTSCSRASSAADRGGDQRLVVDDQHAAAARRGRRGVGGVARLRGSRGAAAGSDHAERGALARARSRPRSRRRAPVTMRWQIDSPSPVPTPTGLVVKNGVNSCAAGSRAGCRRPCRATSTTDAARRVDARARRGSRCSSASPSGIACAALTSRLRNTWPRRASLAAHAAAPSP